MVTPPLTYTIPISNPYTMTVPFLPEIWAWGFRNPWRFTFDRQNGDMYIGDVGQGSWEEIDFQASNVITGPNYGWRCYEGAHSYDFSNNTNCNTPSNFVMPVAEYSHSSNPNTGCSSVTAAMSIADLAILLCRASTFMATIVLPGFGDCN
jgi:glucose/arabinose dehydrogenase